MFILQTCRLLLIILRFFLEDAFCRPHASSDKSRVFHTLDKDFSSQNILLLVVSFHTRLYRRIHKSSSESLVHWNCCYQPHRKWGTPGWWAGMCHWLVKFYLIETMFLPQFGLKQSWLDLQTLYMVIFSVVVIPKLLVQPSIANRKLHVPIYFKVKRNCDAEGELVGLPVRARRHVISPNVPISLPTIECKSYSHFFSVT